jgi:CBS domain-containing protein
MKTQPSRVRDIMTTGIRSVTPNENLADAMIRMESARSRHLPVVRPIEGRGEVDVRGTARLCQDDFLASSSS